jgi:hypothetical protein
MSIDSAGTKDIEVLETIVDGKTVFNKCNPGDLIVLRVLEI